MPLIAPSSDSSPRTTVSSMARRVDLAGCRQQAERDRQVERRPRLAHVRWREVDGDAVRRKLEAGVPDGRSHAVAALAHGRVRQSHHREVGKPERHIHLDVDRVGIDAEDRRAAQAGKHAGADARPCADGRPFAILRNSVLVCPAVVSSTQELRACDTVRCVRNCNPRLSLGARARYSRPTPTSVPEDTNAGCTEESCRRR